MPTKAQKEFKKQMKDIQKDLDKNPKQQVFSYIENDHITSYYGKTKIKRNISISIGTIFTLIIAVYSIYTWFKPLFTYVKIPENINNQTYVQANVISGTNFTSKMDSTHKIVIEYLENVNAVDRLYDELVKYYNASINLNTDENDFKVKFVDKQNICIEKLNTLLNMQVILEATNHRNAVCEYYSILNEKLNFLVVNKGLVNPEDKAKVQEMDDRINKLSILKQQYLLKMFTDVKIQYEVNPDGSVTYHYQE